MEIYGNTTTLNIESLLVSNIKNSDYYQKSALDCDTCLELIDEIYNSVSDVEPWLSGNVRGPSTAFCLLFRLGKLKPTTKDIRTMLDHKDSPYIRAIGFLFLRYCCNPRSLWEWFADYVQDTEKFSPSPTKFGRGKAITIGEYVRDLLLSQFYFETIFPRIPKPVEIDIEKKMRELGVSTHARGNGGQGGPSRRGGGADGGRSRPASVKAALSVGIGNRGPHKSYQHHEDRNRDRERERGRSGSGTGTNRYDRDYHHDGRDSTRDRERSRERNRGCDTVCDTHGGRGTSAVFHNRFTAGASKSNLDNIRQRYT